MAKTQASEVNYELEPLGWKAFKDQILYNSGRGGEQPTGTYIKL
jgi:hypothetical protein